MGGFTAFVVLFVAVFVGGSVLPSVRGTLLFVVRTS
jgi:hypothetical protein